ncbi:MAG: hypothetical protein ETSY2_38100, partial [Candidatus Entotheonella gemina]
MDQAQWLFFGPYRLDRESVTLWRGEERMALRSRALSLLQYLAERPGQVISAQDLQQHAWQGEHASTSLFRVCIHELRQVLQDDPGSSEYIETVRGQGYRLCVPVTVPGGTLLAQAPILVGRTEELAQLQGSLEQARQGQRQLVLLSGEAGMGKSALVETFVGSLAQGPETAIAWGYCLEHTGSVEAYLPILEALGSLGSGSFGEPLVQVLRQAAPTWLKQLPMLMPQAPEESIPIDVPGLTRARIMRELVDALGLLSANRLVVLVLEDLHWSDPSTLDLLSMLMRRRDPSQLLIVGTYRPLELQVHEHPLLGLLQERQGHGQGQDIRLTPLGPEAVSRFLGVRLSGEIDADLAATLHARSDGNPLFLSRLIDYLMQQELVIDMNGQWHLLDDALATQALPEGVRQLLSKQIDQLPEPVQTVLMVASVVGMEVATEAVAAGVETEAEGIDASLAWAASRSYFLHAHEAEIWPDGTISGTYRFGHALYRQVLYERLSAQKRLISHCRIGERLEKAYLDDVEPVVGRLAYHFVQGWDVPRALQYLHHASIKALSRFAANEALTHLHQALELLPALSAEHDREQIEYDLQST